MLKRPGRREAAQGKQVRQCTAARKEKARRGEAQRMVHWEEMAWREVVQHTVRVLASWLGC